MLFSVITRVFIQATDCALDMVGWLWLWNKSSCEWMLALKWPMTRSCGNAVVLMTVVVILIKLAS